MIVQNFLNFWRDVVVNFIGSSPSLPPSWNANLDSVHDASVSIAGTIANLNPVLPFAAIDAYLSFIPAMLGLWLVTSTLRITTRPFLGGK